MNITNIPFEHKYQINDIIELKNTNNEKSVFCKVINIEFDIAPFDSISTTDKIKYTSYLNKNIMYRVYYTVTTLENSYYDTEGLKLFPIDSLLVLNLE